jgi:hypothetical protein
MTPEKIKKLVQQGRLVPIIEQRGNKNYLLGYGRKGTSRKNDKYLLPEPEELTGKI